MSVHISYRKQILLGVIVVVLILGVIEGIAYTWWLNIQHCAFEKNEIFTNFDDNRKRQLCQDLYSIRASGFELIPNQSTSTVNINSLGFRGPEFSAEKPENTYRILLVGGSTMFGSGATSDSTTIPGFLQQIFDNNKFEVNIEVINAAISGGNSASELEFINEKIAQYEPDLVIVYDGWNDLRAERTYDIVQHNWKDMCVVGQKNGFDVIITLQPIAGFGNKILTQQEYVNSITGESHTGLQLIQFRPTYESYAKALKTLEGTCKAVADLRTVFDGIASPIYWDQGHISDAGNAIVAERLFELITPIIKEKIANDIVTQSEISSTKIKNVQQDQTKGISIIGVLSYYKTPTMLAYFLQSQSKNVQTPFNFAEGKYFLLKEQQNTENLLPIGKPISQTEIDNTSLEKTNLVGRNLSGLDLQYRDLRFVDLSFTDLSNAKLNHADLSGSELTKTILVGADLSNAKLVNAKLERVDLSRAIIKNADLTKAEMYQVDLSGKDLTGTILTNAHLFHANLSGLDLSDKNMKMMDLRSTDLRNTNLSNSDFSTEIRELFLTADSFQGIPSEKEVYEIFFQGNKPINVDIMNITRNNEELAITFKFKTMFENANLTNANLQLANLEGVDLQNADLTAANLLDANLKNANLEGAILDCKNHPICN